jgi:site-specific recombinase XerD
MKSGGQAMDASDFEIRRLGNCTIDSPLGLSTVHGDSIANFVDASRRVALDPHVHAKDDGMGFELVGPHRDYIEGFADRLVERGYADFTSRDKLRIVANLSRWLEGKGPLSRDAIEHLVAKHVVTATRSCPTLERKKVTPHVLRHAAAMGLLQSGVDRSVIAIWLGHESLETTQMYLHADMSMKEKAMSRTTPSRAKIPRYRPDDDLMAFLMSL